MNNNLFVKRIILQRKKIDNFDIYPFNIEVIKNLDCLDLNSPVTFFVGENGIGKSTFIEAIAVNLGLNAEGGTQNFMFSTKNTTSILSQFLKIPIYGLPTSKFFLRAESFYNVATEIDNLGVDEYYGGKSLHNFFHGESFLQLIQNRFSNKGLYILDEPEAALSPQRQMTLLCLIDNLVKNGSQFIIATHSPILISYRNGAILNLNDNFSKIKYKETDIYNIYKMYLDNPDDMQKRLFDDIN